MLALLDRLDWVRDTGLDAGREARIHPARLFQLVQEVGIMTTQHLAGVELARRTALLVAQVAELRTRLANATLRCFGLVDRHLGLVIRRSPDYRPIKGLVTTLVPGCSGETPRALPAAGGIRLPPWAPRAVVPASACPWRW